MTIDRTLAIASRIVSQLARDHLGIFISTFARNEFQVVQFIPVILLPQIFLSGAVLPAEQLPSYFQAVGKVLPLTYAVDGLKALMLQGETLGGIGQELAVLGGFCNRAPGPRRHHRTPHLAHSDGAFPLSRKPHIVIAMKIACSAPSSSLL